MSGSGRQVGLSRASCAVITDEYNLHPPSLPPSTSCSSASSPGSPLSLLCSLGVGGSVLPLSSVQCTRGQSWAQLHRDAVCHSDRHLENQVKEKA